SSTSAASKGICGNRLLASSMLVLRPSNPHTDNPSSASVCEKNPTPQPASTAVPSERPEQSLRTTERTVSLRALISFRHCGWSNWVTLNEEFSSRSGKTISCNVPGLLSVEDSTTPRKRRGMGSLFSFHRFVGTGDNKRLWLKHGNYKSYSSQIEK